VFLLHFLKPTQIGEQVPPAYVTSQSLMQFGTRELLRVGTISEKFYVITQVSPDYLPFEQYLTRKVAQLSFEAQFTPAMNPQKDEIAKIFAHGGSFLSNPNQTMRFAPETRPALYEQMRTALQRRPAHDKNTATAKSLVPFVAETIRPSVVLPPPPQPSGPLAPVPIPSVTSVPNDRALLVGMSVVVVLLMGLIVWYALGE